MNTERRHIITAKLTFKDAWNATRVFDNAMFGEVFPDFPDATQRRAARENFSEFAQGYADSPLTLEGPVIAVQERRVSRIPIPHLWRTVEVVPLLMAV